MRSLILTTALALAPLAITVPAEAHEPTPYRTVRLEKADTRPSHIHLVYVMDIDLGGRLYAEFNNGSRWEFRACPRRTSRRCYYDATRGGSESFVRLYGRTFYLNDRSAR